MFKSIKRFIMLSVFYEQYRQARLEPTFRRWEKEGRPIPPPPLAKQRTVQDYARQLSLRILVETGTYLGDMIAANLKNFGRIYSIELDAVLYKVARRRFACFDHVTILQGDSGVVLPSILAEITEPCLFWLDAHYSGGITQMGKTESPIIQELGLILRHQIAGHVVLIDDARNFVWQNSYPSIDVLSDLVVTLRPNWIFEIYNDIIRLHEKPQD